MSVMTREDMLRELELLPVWQLRVPLPAPIATPQPDLQLTQQTQAHVNDIEPTLGSETPQISTAETRQAVAPAQFTCITSDDGDWFFVLPNTPLLADEARLLQNIFIALRIKSQPAQVSANVSEIVLTLKPKRVIAMGESIGQYLLANQQALNELRGIVHTWQATQLVVTYELAHLLSTPSDKAGAWHDLRLVIA
jgi:uracil-DNA glycosylase